jgi:CheY-like chemotaxis protein
MVADRRPGELAPVYRVLVVDDEVGTIDMVARMLHGRYHAVGAQNAGDALVLVEEDRFDAAIVDQRLGDGTGTAVLAHCAEKSPLCRRIAMSGQATMGDLLAAINLARVSHYLSKPFSQDRLLAALSSAMAEYEAERAALERLLVARGAEAAAHHRVGERRGGRRSRGRGRPAHWPAAPTLRPVSAEDPTALFQLFDPDVSMVLAVLRPERQLAYEEMEAWCAELELRLVTLVRDSDQTLRMPDGRFAVAFARTPKDGCRRACRRLAEGLRGGLLFDLLAWPEMGSPELVQHILHG